MGEADGGASTGLDSREFQSRLESTSDCSSETESDDAEKALDSSTAPNRASVERVEKREGRGGE